MNKIDFNLEDEAEQIISSMMLKNYEAEHIISQMTLKTPTNTTPVYSVLDTAL